MIEFALFTAVEMRVGRIVTAEPFPEARQPSYKLTIDFGADLGLKRSSAQLTELYSRDELVGTLVIAATNLRPKRIAGFHSDVLVLGVPDAAGNVVLLRPERHVDLGVRVF
ncbi:MAG TPA: tRNA-binding protein [Candidatus Acidoferrales bacterium]|nr:tRNA-binding protein [Candidatus Acidoferrales bacterium]